MVEEYYFRLIATSTIALILVGIIASLATYRVKDYLPSTVYVVISWLMFFLAGLIGHNVLQDNGIVLIGDRATDIVFGAAVGMAAAFLAALMIYKIHLLISDRT
ncbi:MAG: hypothetical protein AAF732_07740 [Pseudomonadota bacterium]